MNLQTMGWNETWAEQMRTYVHQGYTAGRVMTEHKHQYRVWTETGDFLASVTGKMRYEAVSQADYPAVGDWVVVSERPEEARATIHAILPRQSKFSRKVAGNDVDEQIVAANVDTVFIVSSLNHDLNLRRIERTLILAWESGANPVIVLSKADLCEDPTARMEQVEAVAMGVDVHAVSSWMDGGLSALDRYLVLGKTIALLGSSGVGKSTIINHLMGSEALEVGAIREEDSRGRHTTTHRQLLLLPSGAWMMDTPGMREMQLWEADTGVSQTFEDIEQLAQACKFHDCTHRSEPDCAVLQALADERLSEARLRNYQKMLRELAHMERKAAKNLRAAGKEQGRKQAKATRSPKRMRDF